ncbi:MAG TPA: hypothetical protein VI076_10635, partial [Actinopolymorphaceae bacterium]
MGVDRWWRADEPDDEAGGDRPGEAGPKRPLEEPEAPKAWVDPRSWLSPEDRLKYYRRHEPMPEQGPFEAGSAEQVGGGSEPYDVDSRSRAVEATLPDDQEEEVGRPDGERSEEPGRRGSDHRDVASGESVGIDADSSRPGEEELLRHQAVFEYRGSRANLEDFQQRDAGAYVREHVGERPWLGSALDQGREVQRVFASIDSGRGHFLQRHEGFAADDQRLVDRLVYRHDPAQVDAVARTAMKDGTRPGEHHCGGKATAIRDPLAFAAAFARGIEHPKVRALLDDQVPNRKPKSVDIPIEELLGPDGHRDCVGYRLVPIEGNTRKAEKYRDAWAKSVAKGIDPGGPPPQVEPIESFEGGTIRFVLTPAAGPGDRETLTMYPE